MNFCYQIIVELIGFSSGVHETNDKASDQHLILNIAVISVDLLNIGYKIISLNILIGLSIHLCTIDMVESNIGM
jgi:hypothetical protein